MTYNHSPLAYPTFLKEQEKQEETKPGASQNRQKLTQVKYCLIFEVLTTFIN